MQKGLVFRVGISFLSLGCLGIVIFGSLQEFRLFSVESKTGNVRWSVPLAISKGRSTTPVVSNGTVFTKLLLENGGESQWTYQIAAYQAETGKQRWKQELNSQNGSVNGNPISRNSLPVITPKTLLVILPLKASDTYSQLMVFDRQTGEYQRSPHRFFYPNANFPGVLSHAQTLLGTKFEQTSKTKFNCDQTNISLTQQDLWAKEIQWIIPLPNRFCHDHWQNSGKFMMADDNTLFVSGEGKIQGWNIKTKQLVFQISAEGEDMALSQNTLVVEMRRGIHAYDVKTGQKKWMSDNPCGYPSSVKNMTADLEQVYIHCDDYVYRGSRNRLVTLRLDSGKPDWSSNSNSPFFHIPAVTAKEVVVIDTVLGKSYVTSLFKGDGQVRSRFPISHPQPYQSTATDDTHIYVVDRAPRWRHWIARWKPKWY